MCSYECMQAIPSHARMAVKDLGDIKHNLTLIDPIKELSNPVQCQEAH